MHTEGGQNTGGTQQLLRISSCYLQFQNLPHRKHCLYYSDLWVNAVC
jgi:hypothetical protein